MKSLDYRITEKIYKVGHRHQLIWSLISRRALLIFLFFYIALWFVVDCPKCLIMPGILILTIPFLISLIIRSLIKRSRPHFENKEYVPWLKAWSFPSLHATTAFAFATGLILLTSGLWSNPIHLTVSILLMLLAGVISTSRLALGVHYISDIIVGALLGVAVSVILLGL